MNNDVQRASGIIVPARLATMPDPGSRIPKGPAVSYDPDGRRRIIIDGDQLRRQDRLLRDMGITGQSVIVVCREDFRRADGVRCCGQPMVREMKPDEGYGCLCTRIHVVQ